MKAKKVLVFTRALEASRRLLSECAPIRDEFMVMPRTTKFFSASDMETADAVVVDTSDRSAQLIIDAYKSIPGFPPVIAGAPNIDWVTAARIRQLFVRGDALEGAPPRPAGAAVPHSTEPVPEQESPKPGLRPRARRRREE